jgi:CheY-like chemotaxis protein
LYCGPVALSVPPRRSARGMISFMPRIRLVHWREAEARLLADALREDGHAVDYEAEIGPGLMRQLRAARPDVLVIDLSRLPSQGKAVAALVRRTKHTQEIPILFHAGLPEKVDAVRSAFPDELYAPSLAHLRKALKGVRLVPAGAAPARAGGIANPNRTAAEKLGIRAGAKVGVLNPPREYLRVLGALPDAVEFAEDGVLQQLLLWFVHDAEEFRARLPEARAWAARTKLWVLWRKQATGKSVLTQLEIRRLAGVFGLVDYKICSVDDTWSGMLFALRK